MELCKLARVTGPEFPPPLLSSPTLPASDWPMLRGGIKDSACPVCRPSLRSRTVSVDVKHHVYLLRFVAIVQELCESRGGRPGLSVLTSLLVSVDVKIYCTVLRHWSQLVPNMSHDI